MYIVKLTELGELALKEWNTRIDNDDDFTEEDDMQEITPLGIVDGEASDCEFKTEENTLDSLIKAIKEYIKDEDWNSDLFDGSRLNPEWFEFTEMKLYEVYLQITEEGQHNAYLIVHIEDIIEDEKEDEAVVEAFDYAVKVLKIDESKLELHSVDQLN